MNNLRLLKTTHNQSPMNRLYRSFLILLQVCALLLVMPLFAQQESKDLIVEGVDAMYARDHARSLELLAEARALAEENGWDEELFLALNNIGANYFLMLDYGEAQEYYLEAYTLAIRSLTESHEMSVLNNIAILYSKQDDLDRALEYFEKAYDLAVRTDSPHNQAIYAVNIGQIHVEQSNPSLALEFFEEAAELMNEDSRLDKDIRLSSARAYFELGEIERSLNIGNALLPELQTEEWVDQRVSLTILLSRIDQERGVNEAALARLTPMVDDSLNLENRMLVYEQMVKIHKASNEYAEASRLQDSLAIFQQRRYDIQNDRIYETNRVKFEVANYKDALEDKKAEVEEQRRFFITVSALVAILLILGGWAVRNAVVTARQREKLAESNQKITALALEKEKTENELLENKIKEKETAMLLEREQLKNEIEAKNRKLSAKALYLSDRNDLIESLIHDLEGAGGGHAPSSIDKNIRNLKHLLKEESERDSFIKHFEEVNQGFLSNLKQKHPDLNANDIRFISYLYMNLTQKEIALIFNITPEACRKRKERISKKMGLQDSGKLYDYLYEF